MPPISSYFPLSIDFSSVTLSTSEYHHRRSKESQTLRASLLTKLPLALTLRYEEVTSFSHSLLIAGRIVLTRNFAKNVSLLKATTLGISMYYQKLWSHRFFLHVVEKSRNWDFFFFFLNFCEQVCTFFF